jgi:hypothetical protein
MTEPETTQPEAEAEVPAPAEVEVVGESHPADYSYVIRATVALVLLGLVVIALAGIIVDYRARVMRSAAAAAAKTASKHTVKPSVPTTSSKPATRTPSKAPAAGRTIVVLVDGVNFRERPSGSAKIISALRGGTKLTLVEEQSGWYRATTSDGVSGWLTSSSQYVKRQ